MRKALAIFFALLLCACAGKNPYLNGLKCGTDNLWANKPEQSIECFDAAEVADPGNYEVKDYEKIMLNTYQGVGFLALGDAFANQSFRRAYALQVQTVQENSAQIQRQQEEFKKSARRIPGMPPLNSIVSDINAELELNPQVAAMRDFVNPYTTWLGAVYDGVVSRDMPNADNFMRRVMQFAPDNQFVRTDMEAIRARRDLVWVVFENGNVGRLYERALAPRGLQAWNINLTVPDLAPGGKALPFIEVDGVRTEFLASMDSIVKTDLIKYRTQHIISSVIFEVGKVAIATGAMVGGVVAANSNQKYGGLMMMGGWLLANAAMGANKSWDLRGWHSLPSEIQVARLNMPASRKLNIPPVGIVAIPDGIRNAIVFVRISSDYKNVVIGKLN
ncbi:MAG: hypothetical protein FWF97_04590 [Alphaproteobacteria bacterium]|nr:hypothetical protein [Alphaproteobacteria bacterium]